MSYREELKDLVYAIEYYEECRSQLRRVDEGDENFKAVGDLCVIAWQRLLDLKNDYFKRLNLKK